jgi:hypothetical protein
MCKAGEVANASLLGFFLLFDWFPENTRTISSRHASKSLGVAIMRNEIRLLRWFILERKCLLAFYEPFCPREFRIRLEPF